MALISQPGSDYQIVSISLDAGYTRDLILMLIDVHAVLDHLYLDGTQPQHHRPRRAGLPAPIRQPLHPARPHRRSRRGCTRPAQPRRTPSARPRPARPARIRTSRQQSRRQLSDPPQSRPHREAGPDQRRTPSPPVALNAGPHKRRTVGPVGVDTARLAVPGPAGCRPGTAILHNFALVAMPVGRRPVLN